TTEAGWGWELPQASLQPPCCRHRHGWNHQLDTQADLAEPGPRGCPPLRHVVVVVVVVHHHHRHTDRELGEPAGGSLRQPAADPSLSMMMLMLMMMKKN